MHELFVEERFDLGVDELWRAVSDLERHPDWMRDAVGVRFLSGQRQGVGTVFVIELGVGRRRLVSDRLEVITWDEPHELAVTHGLGPVSAVSSFVLSPDGDRARLRWQQRYVMPRWLGGTAAERAGAPAVRALLRANLRGLRRWIASGGEGVA